MDPRSAADDVTDDGLDDVPDDLTGDLTSDVQNSRHTDNFSGSGWNLYAADVAQFLVPI